MSQKKIFPQPIGTGNLPSDKNQQVKSMKSTPKSLKENPEKLTQTSSKTCMQLIFQANKQYLMDKIQISQIPKPSKYYHKIPSKTPNTTYNNQFHKINAHMMNQLKLQRKDNLYNLKDNVSGYQSLYCQNFGDNQRSKSLAATNKKQNLLKKENPKYQPNQAPAFLQTSYSLNFVGNYNPIPAQSTKMKECKLMGGGKFQGQTTYHGVFKNYESKKQQPIHQTNNKIFMTIDTPKETTYEKEFNSRKVSKSIKKSSENQEKSSRKRVSSEMVQAGKEMQKKKFKSEYERSFQTIQPASGRNTKKVSLMSLQQMKTLILNSL